LSLQTWIETLVTQHAAGTAFNTYTSAKTVINPQALAVLPAGFFSPGKSVRIRVLGAISNIVTTPGTITFQVMIGSAIAFTSGAIQLNATAHTLLPFAHWLPRRWWHALLRATGNERWASEQMLNPLTARDLLDLFPPEIKVRIERQRLLGLTTVLIAVAERPAGERADR